MVKEHLKAFFSRTKKASRLKLCKYHLGLKVYQIYSNEEPRWDLTFSRHGKICVLVAVAILEECCMASTDMQWLYNCDPRASRYIVFVCRQLHFNVAL